MQDTRHPSAQELDFLKQVYKKNLIHENGGTTLDLINPMIQNKIIKKFPHEKNYNEYYRRELKSIHRQLNDQKKILSDAFIEDERKRHEQWTMPVLTVSGFENRQRSQTSVGRSRFRSGSHHKQQSSHNNESNEKIRIRPKTTLGRSRRHQKRERGRGSRRPKSSHISGYNARSEIEKQAQNVSSQRAYNTYLSKQKKSLAGECYTDPFVFKSVKKRLHKMNKSEHHRNSTDMMWYANSLAKTKSSLRGAF